MENDAFGRLVVESADLDRRTHALNDFIGSSDHFMLSDESKELLDQQFALMCDLGVVLRKRIALELPNG